MQSEAVTATGVVMAEPPSFGFRTLAMYDGNARAPSRLKLPSRLSNQPLRSASKAVDRINTRITLLPTVGVDYTQGVDGVKHIIWIVRMKAGWKHAEHL